MGEVMSMRKLLPGITYIVRLKDDGLHHIVSDSRESRSKNRDIQYSNKWTYFDRF